MKNSYNFFCINLRTSGQFSLVFSTAGFLGGVYIFFGVFTNRLVGVLSKNSFPSSNFVGACIRPKNQ